MPRRRCSAQQKLESAISGAFAKTKGLISGATKKILDELTKRHDKLEAKVDDLTKTLSSLSGDVKAMRESIKSIEQAFQASAQGISNLDKKLDALRLEVQIGHPRFPK